MATKFTEEQIAILKASPYVLKCSDCSVTFTEEFKELFVQEYELMPSPVLIFEKYGLSKAVSRKRIKEFSHRIRKQSQRVEGFRDLRADSSGRPRTKDLSLEEELEYYKNKAEILRQENDFLKRVRFINKRQISKQLKTKPSKTNSN